MNAPKAGRIKKKYNSPNPLFIKWLTEWKNDAKEKGLKTQFTYAKALASLKRYPLPLSSGKEAKILEFFGDKICSMLDAKLIEYRQGDESTSQSTVLCKSLSAPIPRKTKEPSISSKTNDLVKTVRAGRVAAVKRTFAIAGTSDVQCNHVAAEVQLEKESFNLFPGTFSIILCVDNCESLSGHGKSKKQFVAELQKSGIDYEVRKLHVGDFLWVARDNQDSNKELVLDFIIERKRMDDLAHSIKDGRFREQKFRMRNCGLKNPVYLMEHCTGAKYLGLPESTLEQAMVNIQVIDGFLVKKTQGVKESALYLSLMTKMLKNKYQNLLLSSGSRDTVMKKSHHTNIFLNFKEFNCSSVKNKSLTVKEMFAKHLLQFYGLSVDRAAAIVERFQTPSVFLDAYRQCSSDNERVQMIASIKFGLNKKNIGPAISKSLLQYYFPG